MTDFLKLIATRLFIIFACGVVLVLCVNEVAAQGWLDASPLKNTPLASLTWSNVIGGPKKWQALGWFNLKPVQETATTALTKLPAPILQLAGQASPSGATSATFSASQAAQLASASATTSAQASTPSAQVIKSYWQKFQTELGQIWERTKTVASATQTFIRTQLFTTTPKTTASPSAATTPLEQRALEYAKYMYCKETVTTYEKLNPEVVTPHTTK